MDNNPLTYILTSAKLDATGHHWVVSLANYNFALSYKSGKVNVDADNLSHIPWENHDQHIEADMGTCFKCETGYHLDSDMFLQYTGH